MSPDVPQSRRSLPRRPLPGKAGPADPGLPHKAPRPYGYKAQSRARGKGFVAFGVSYLAVRGIIIVILALAAILVGPYIINIDAAPVGRIVVLLSMALGYGVYCVTAAVLAIKGKVAGLILGMIDIGASLALQLVGILLVFASGELPGVGGVLWGAVWLFMNLGLMTLAIWSLVRRGAAGRRAVVG